MSSPQADANRAIVDLVNRYIDREAIPVACELALADQYPEELVAQMADLGLFGAIIPQEYGGVGLGF